VPWLAEVSLPGICKLLKRLNVCYRRGQAHVHSPDQRYDQKLADITNARILAQSAPQEVVFLYEDEFTVFSRPSVGRCSQPCGCKGAKATGAALMTRRLAGCVDVATGAVIVRPRDRFNVKEMYRFFYFVEKQYPDADIMYIALDNWPLHFHGDVTDHLKARNSRIRWLRLPTYAPWTNPMEKVWLKFSRERLPQHPFGTKWTLLKEMIARWFDTHREGSAELLHEIGLLPLEA
jgi:transposase